MVDKADPHAQPCFRLRVVDEPPRLTREQRIELRAKIDRGEGPETFATRKADHVELYGSAGRCRFETGDRVLYRNPCGIGGLLLAAKIRGFSVDSYGYPNVVALEVEPSAALRAVADWMRESQRTIDERFPKSAAMRPVRPPQKTGLSGEGGSLFLTGEGFVRAVGDGLLGLAADDEDRRALEARQLEALPDWWDARRAQLEDYCERSTPTAAGKKRHE